MRMPTAAQTCTEERPGRSSTRSTKLSKAASSSTRSRHGCARSLAICSAVEPNARNPAMHLLAKSGRFGTVSQRKLTDTPDVVGPGTYNEHKHRTVAQDAARQVKMMSRQSPGFGVASAAHALPHEEEIEETSGSPGPGTYETDKSELAKANGHPSAFKLPTERKKLRNMVAPTRGAPPKSKRKPAADASSPDGAIRV